MNREELKQLSLKQLNETAQALSRQIEEQYRDDPDRQAILDSVAVTLAMNVVFDADQDQFVYDQKRQTVVQRLLDPDYEPFCAVNPGSALAIGLGYETARETRGTAGGRTVVYLEGDALRSGSGIAALKYAGLFSSPLVIIVNDSSEARLKNGVISRTITRFRTSDSYLNVKQAMTESLSKNAGGVSTLISLMKMKDAVKDIVLSDSIFKGLDVDYLGPVNGGSMKEILSALRAAGGRQSPIVVHVITPHPPLQPARRQGPYRPTNEIVCQRLLELAGDHEDLYVVATGDWDNVFLSTFGLYYPERFCNLGYSYEMAVSFSAALARKGLHPLLILSSAACQRCASQINGLLAAYDLPVTICLNGAGLTGVKGVDYGTFDIGLLSNIPQLVISCPHDSREMADLLATALQHAGPMILRYGDNLTREDEAPRAPQILPIGRWESTATGKGAPCAVVISYGQAVDRIREKALSNALTVRLVNARFIKPLDQQMLQDIAQQHLPVFVYNTDRRISGLGGMILQYYNAAGLTVDLRDRSVPDRYAAADSPIELRRQYGVDLNHLFQELEACRKK